MIELSESLRVSHSPDGAVLLDIVNGKIYGLNLVASRILRLLSAGCTPDEIASEISREFTVEAAVARRDLQEFLGQLAKHRFIQERGKIEGGAQ